jgi:hypothetical protein
MRHVFGHIARERELVITALRQHIRDLQPAA